MQYVEGTVAVTNGSATVNAVDPDPGDGGVTPGTAWLTEVSVGDLFIVEGDAVWYTVASITDDDTLVLGASYQGTTVAPSGTPQVGINYAIHRDFSTNYNFPILSRGDIETATAIREAVDQIDGELKSLDDRITALEP